MEKALWKKSVERFANLQAILEKIGRSKKILQRNTRELEEFDVQQEDIVWLMEILSNFPVAPARNPKAIRWELWSSYYTGKGLLFLCKEYRQFGGYQEQVKKLMTIFTQTIRKGVRR